MKIAICDDNSKFRDELKALLRYICQPEDSIESFRNGSELTDTITKGGYVCDVVLLDIQMPGMDGIETARYLRTVSPGLIVILVTSHPQYALIGYEVRAFHYLLKPVSTKDLCRVLEDARREAARGKREYLSIVTRDKVMYLPLRDVTFIESFGPIVHVHTDKTVYSYYRKISALESELAGKGFYRVHKSYIVNMFAVRSVDKIGFTAALSDGSVIPVSRRKLDKFMSALLGQRRRTT